ncbi:hypothetical protein ABXS75_07775 [Roseburia hominis]
MSIYEYDEERHMRQTREEGRKEGEEEGRREGIECMEQLILLLSQQNRLGEAVRAAEDSKFREQLFKEFNL